jgi:hypothetical protein
MHGVDGGAPYSISTGDHRRLLQYLKEQSDVIRVAPLREVILHPDIH